MPQRSWVVAIALLTLGACSEREGPHRVVHDDTPPSADVDTLLLVLDVGDGLPGTLEAVTLHVDGGPWGRFDAPPSSPALVRAKLGAEIGEDAPATAGDWARLLARPLPPGGHVLEIVSVETTVDGVASAHEIHELVPFDVREGAASVYVGRVSVGG